MMKISITGANGYLGKLLLHQLKDESNIDINPIDKNVTKEYPHSNIIAKADICDKNQINEVLKDSSIVIHLAGIPYVQKVNNDIKVAEKVNIEGTRNIVNASKNVDRLIFLSTSGVYGEQKGMLDENSPLNPLNSYSRQKLTGENIIKNSSIPYIILRPSNVYGYGITLPREPLIHQMIFDAFENGEITISDIELIRNFIHVWDCCTIIKKCLFEVNTNEIYNVGNDEYKLYEIAKYIKDIFKKHNNNVKISTNNLNEVTHKLRYSSDKLFSQIKYRPIYDIKEGINEVIEKQFFNVK